MTQENLCPSWPAELFNGELALLLDKPPCDALLMEALSENWFSNQLAWLLDPKGTHGLGVSFVRAFLAMLELKHPALANCSVLREFQLTPFNKGKPYSCDVAIMDLDLDDNLFVAIENKLYTNDRDGQLDGYLDCVKGKFTGVKNLRFVFLSLTGEEPTEALTSDTWVPISWIEDIVGLLAECIRGKVAKGSSVVQRVNDFCALLEWMALVYKNVKTKPEIVASFKNSLIEIAGVLLRDELRRLNEKGRGNWDWLKMNGKKATLAHSSYPSSKLEIGLATGLLVTVQGLNTKGTLFEKVLIPLGTQPDQVFNLIDLASREITYRFFQNSVSAYLDNKRRLKNHGKDSVKTRLRPHLEKIYRHRHSLQVVIRMANKGNRA